VKITNWRKSRRSTQDGSCVEAGWTPEEAGFRDPKQAGMPEKERPVIVVPRLAGAAMVLAIKAGVA